MRASSLCLLDRMYPKLIRKYQAKGIFTVTQLSYLFKPRRRRKRKSQPPPTFNLELQALALRTGKIYLNESPSIPENPVEIFLDIEGIPDENFDYLIGLLVKDHDQTTEHYFWADSQSDEQSMFEECIDAATRYGDAPIYHYGSYEPKALLRAAKDYGIKCKSLVDRLVNVNSWIFGRVYFPSRSNGLKDLGPLVGAKWGSPDASGLQSLVWRYRWEDTGYEELKQRLIEYNRNDCHALSLLTSGLREIGKAADAREDVDFANAPKQLATTIGQDIHHALDGILTSAHADYERKHIRIAQRASSVSHESRRGRPPKGARAIDLRRVPTKGGITVRVPRRRKCPRHKKPLQPEDQLSEHRLIDLRFSTNGCRKTTVRYVGRKGYCPLCRRSYPLQKASVKAVIASHLGRTSAGTAVDGFDKFLRGIMVVSCPPTATPSPTRTASGFRCRTSFYWTSTTQASDGRPWPEFILWGSFRRIARHLVNDFT